MSPEREKIVLASASPRRQALLRAAGVPFEVRVSGIDEEVHQVGTPAEQALATARAKAAAIAPELAPGTLLLAADTMVVLDGIVYNKPTDRDDARAMLERLAGRRHTVVTAIWLGRTGGKVREEAVETGVVFHPPDAELIRRYVASGEPDDKAGSYGIQGLGAQLVESVDGDVTGVIGLPMRRLADFYAELTGAALWNGRALLQVARDAFPELDRLPEACLRGLGGPIV